MTGRCPRSLLTGGRADLGSHGRAGDSLNLVWAPSGDSIWFEEGWLAGAAIHALPFSGPVRVVHSFPVGLRLLDVSKDGRVLVSRVQRRAATNCLPAGEKVERDLSWFDASEVSDFTPDGKRS